MSVHVYNADVISTSEYWSDDGWEETSTIDAQIEDREERSPLLFLNRRIVVRLYLI